MRKFLVLICILGGFSAYGKATETNEIEALKERVAKLELVIQNKCKMVYKFWAHRMNRCDKGSFVRGIVETGSPNANQLECGYYQLSCEE